MMFPSRLRGCILAGSITLAAGFSASGQVPKSIAAQVLAANPSPSPSATAKPDAPDLKSLKEKLAAAQKELNAAPGGASDSSVSGSDSFGDGPADEPQDVRGLLSRIVGAYSRAIASLGNLANEQQRSADLDQEEATWKWVDVNGKSADTEGKLPFKDAPPFPIRMVDDLRESLQDVNQNAKTVAYTLALVNNRKGENASHCKDLEAKLRQVSEMLESGAKDGTAAQLGSQRERLQLSIRASAANQEMFAVEQKLWEAKAANLKRTAELLKRQIAAAASKMQFTQAELDKISAGFAAQSKKLKKEFQKVEADNQAAQSALAEARQNYLAAQQTASAPDSPEQSAKLAQLKQLLDIRQVQAETATTREEHLNWIQKLADQELGAWKSRFTALSGDPQKAVEARQRFASMVEKLRILNRYYQAQAGVNSRQLADLEDYTRNSAAASPAPESLKGAQEKLDSFRLRDDSYKRLVKTLDRLERQVQRWNEELADGEPQKLDAKKQMAGWVIDGRKALGDLWHREIYTVADPTFTLGNGVRPITLGKFITALWILLIGYFVCRLMARKMQRFLTSRVHMENNMAEIIRGWMLFFLSLALVMMVMDFVKIPLTAFAFLGGALALAIGFGTQNLLKNFISGIMLLVEQPLRLGDLVEVGACRGKVVSIGIRSSIIRNSDGIETLIPNSTFLENNVTNWTYSNPQVRFKIKVTVAFSSSSREVSDLLERVLDSHGKVNKDPKPQVLLEEFSEKGMVFSVYYWLEPLKTDSSMVASDLRFMIERQLSEAGIMMV